jgi:hypothetical protein
MRTELAAALEIIMAYPKVAALGITVEKSVGIGHQPLEEVETPNSVTFSIARSISRGCPPTAARSRASPGAS